MPTFWWSHLVNPAPSMISSSFNCSMQRSWSATTACSRYCRGDHEGIIIHPLWFRLFPIKLGNSDGPRCPQGPRRPCAHRRDTYGCQILTTWFCHEFDEWLCHTEDYFLQRHTCRHVSTRHEPCTCSLLMICMLLPTRKTEFYMNNEQIVYHSHIYSVP